MHYLVNLWNALDLKLFWDITIRIISVLICLTIHETSHGLAAWLLGDITARSEHRISLNPLHHIDWLGLISLLIAGIGWAKPVPVDSRYFKNKKLGMAITAFAGPLSNFLLAFLCIMIFRFATINNNFLLELLIRTAIISIGLGVFNLIPIPPLDGSKMIAVIIPNKYYDLLMRYERFGMLLLFFIIYLGSLNNFINTSVQMIFNFIVELLF